MRPAPALAGGFREFQDGAVISGTRYRVLRLLGAGGMGRVYEVEHLELGKRFVLKALQSSLAQRQDLVARLRNEWRALARLEHPNIVSVTDAGSSEDGVSFYVMERLEGETLAARLLRHGRLLPPCALELAIGILEGLAAAHRIGVVHRDVKPPNVFLTGPTSLKLLDFGIAKMGDAGNVITARGIAVGTPRYMSPEQASGVEVDARADIYAAGLLLFEMLSGRGPFEDVSDPNELRRAHLERAAPLLSSVSVVAPELDDLVAAMLAKDPRQRPQDAQELARQLRGLLPRYQRFASTDEPTLALPIARPPRRARTPLLPTLYGPDTVVDGATSAPTVVPGASLEPTEELHVPPLPPDGDAARDAVPTHTVLPLPAALPPARAPLAPSTRPRSSIGRRLPKAASLLAAGMAVLSFSGVGALAVHASSSALQGASPRRLGADLSRAALPRAPAAPALPLPAAAPARPLPALPEARVVPAPRVASMDNHETIVVTGFAAGKPRARSSQRPRPAGEPPLRTFILPRGASDPGF